MMFVFELLLFDNACEGTAGMHYYFISFSIEWPLDFGSMLYNMQNFRSFM